jgi:hypothetical protein
MVGTTNQLAAVTRIVDQFQIPVSAHIMESTDLILLITQQEQGSSRHLYRAHITAAGKLVCESGKHPAIGKQLLLLQLKEVCTGIGRTGQTMGRGTDIIEVTQKR